MAMHNISSLFVSLGLGYVLCVLAKKQEKILKSVGYTLGISIIVISLLTALAMSDTKWCRMKKMGGMCGMKKPHSMMNK